MPLLKNDDSIITDTHSARSMMQSEIAAGIAQPWEYRARFYGESDDEAQGNVPAKDTGFDMLTDDLS